MCIRDSLLTAPMGAQSHDHVTRKKLCVRSPSSTEPSSIATHGRAANLKDLSVQKVTSADTIIKGEKRGFSDQ